jgi:hypothetical protein
MSQLHQLILRQQRPPLADQCSSPRRPIAMFFHDEVEVEFSSWDIWNISICKYAGMETSLRSADVRYPGPNSYTMVLLLLGNSSDEYEHCEYC